MPVVRRAENDMMRYLRTHLVDFMVNLTNLDSRMGAGLQKEYADRFPELPVRFQQLVADGKLGLGSKLIYTHRDHRAGATAVINLITKRHFADASTLADTKRALRALREYLIDYPLHTLAMPMLSGAMVAEVDEPGLLTAEGEPLRFRDVPQSEVLALIYDYLDDLDNVIHLCQRPAAFDHEPRYLGIIGPHKYHDREAVRRCVLEACDGWGISPGAFDNFVSGGAKGVDAIACGTDRRDASYATSLAAEFLPGVPPIICKADWDRLGNGAGPRRNVTVVDILTHGVAILPADGSKVTSVGTPGALRIVEKYNQLSDPRQHKQVRVFELPM